MRFSYSIEASRESIVCRGHGGSYRFVPLLASAVTACQRIKCEVIGALVAWQLTGKGRAVWTEQQKNEWIEGLERKIEFDPVVCELEDA